MVSIIMMQAELMIMASYQTFSGQLWHLTDQAKFDQTNLPYIINEEVNKFTIVKPNVRTIFNPYHKHCVSDCPCLYGYTYEYNANICLKSSLT